MRSRSTLALMDFGGGINYLLAWGYVGLRILHSLVQGTVNIVRYRLTSSPWHRFCLLGLTVHAGARILHDCGGIHYRLKAAASSTWVDQRNWPTGRAQSRR